MGGGLLQLVADGAQDVSLTGNPQITFFKVVYRRHTNFALEAIEQTFNGTPAFDTRVVCQISRNGDLIHRVYLQVRLPSDGDNYCKFFGLRLIDYVEVEIGGQRIDKQYSHWMYIWNELTLPEGKRNGYNDMVGAKGGSVSSTDMNKTLYIPLEFWFCRNVGLALPLIALQYHEVKINLHFDTQKNCSTGTTATATPFAGASLWVDYIYLDTDERRRFAQMSHEYLIEQVQYTGPESIESTTSSSKIKLNFNHPCKELIWFVGNSSSNGNNWFNYTNSLNSLTTEKTRSEFNAKLVFNGKIIKSDGTNGSKNPIIKAKLVLNGNDRFAERQGSYFNLIQPYQHHENIPANAGINVYSFGLKPEEHQPSGTLNMSRIDTAVLNVTFDSTYTTNNAGALSFYIYAVNYNVLRILSGMGGLAYSN